MTQTLSPTLQNFIQTKNLDISIVEINDLGLTSRMDAEAYRPQFFQNELKIKGHKWGYFSDFLEDITGGATPLGANYLDSGVPFIRVQNVMQNYFNLNEIVYISENDNKKLKRSQLKKNDVMLTITGVSYGKSATVDDSIVGANMNQHSVRMQFKDIEPFYVSTFLNSTFGKSQSDKNIVGLSRPALDYDSIKGFYIPLPSQPFQEKIASMVQEAHKQRELSKSLYGKAEKILLDELGLSNWKPSEENIAVKSSDEVNLFGRCDAEFFQPKYDEILSKTMLWNTKKLDKLFDIFGGKSYKYTGFKDQIKVIKTKNLRLDEIDLEGVEDYISDNEKNKTNVQFVQKRDVLFASMGVGSLGRSNIFYRDETNCVVDSTVKILREKNPGNECSAELLNVYFQLDFMQDLIYRYVVGSSGIINFYDSDLKNLPIPILPDSIQSLISGKIIASHIARETSKKLLEQAKRAVEIFIEEDEQSAEKFLELNT